MEPPIERSAGTPVVRRSEAERQGVWRDPEYGPEDLDTRRERLYRTWHAHLMAEARSTYEARSRHWRYDFSSPDAYERSVAPMRRRWRETLGGWPRRRAALNLRREVLASPAETGGRYTLERLWFTAITGVEVDALLLTPPGSPEQRRPAVVAQHGLNGTPEEVVGVVPGAADGPYRRLGLRLVERGYVVIAPHMVGGYGEPVLGATHDPGLAGKVQGRARTQLNRIAVEYGRTLMGLEMFVLSRAVDLLQALPNVDPHRIGMYGLSQGGQSALYFPALDERIAAVVISGYFNERFGKQLVPSERYTSYIGTEEEDKFLMGRLRAFGDAELASLICPRPVFVEHGRVDRIGWWEFVRVEFDRVHELYERLGMGERAQFGLHEGPHEVNGAEALPFLDRWLVP